MHNHIKQSDRVCIEFLLKKIYSHKDTGKELEFHRTIIQREVDRNSVDEVIKNYQMVVMFFKPLEF